MLVYLNGRIVPAEEATVSVLDHGFLYGAGLFETMRTAGGVPMFWPEHACRLRESAAWLSIPLPWSDAELERAIVETVRANGLEEAYVRLTVSRGEGALGPSGKTCAAPTLVIYVKELVLPPVTGRNLVVLTTVRSTPETPVRAKTLNYLNSLLAYRELEQRGAAEGIQLTQDGYIAEGAVSNLFFVVQGEIWTPALETGCLPGITRDWVLQQLPVMEKRFTLADIAGATEAFTSSSVVGILPATAIEGVPIGSGEPGPVTLQLIENWKKNT
ncbi:branched chain amino acid aminotransferase [Tumebacillus sp. BK434]|uniref:aminotransferase class IV n=1 Tax=Tumebacillus sp. BK434 TaxID=2512169 RepID=UPI001043A0F9|nr:aminotransferase class IV [Tumebacillus sp. BK434]TCP53378.1 branched chain amino acid aminotransferase [Tumebacillus sp. BK434]